MFVSAGGRTGKRKEREEEPTSSEPRVMTNHWKGKTEDEGNYFKMKMAKEHWGGEGWSVKRMDIRNQSIRKCNKCR